MESVNNFQYIVFESIQKLCIDGALIFYDYLSLTVEPFSC